MNLKISKIFTAVANKSFLSWWRIQKYEIFKNLWKENEDQILYTSQGWPREWWRPTRPWTRASVRRGTGCWSCRPPQARTEGRWIWALKKGVKLNLCSLLFLPLLYQGLAWIYNARSEWDREWLLIFFHFLSPEIRSYFFVSASNGLRK